MKNDPQYVAAARELRVVMNNKRDDGQTPMLDAA